MSKDMSMADKVKKLGFDVDEFKKDLFALNDKMIDKCTLTLDFSRKNLGKNVYPDLKKMKKKYGIDIPIGLCGVDMLRLDKRLDEALRKKINKKP